jgi:hypothetical protein
MEALTVSLSHDESVSRRRRTRTDSTRYQHLARVAESVDAGDSFCWYGSSKFRFAFRFVVLD